MESTFNGCVGPGFSIVPSERDPAECEARDKEEEDEETIEEEDDAADDAEEAEEADPDLFVDSNESKFPVCSDLCSWRRRIMTSSLLTTTVESPCSPKKLQSKTSKSASST
jgi:hypothetical protein